MKNGISAVVTAAILALLSACGGGGGGAVTGGTAGSNNAGAALVSIAVLPAAPSIAAGTTQQFAATGSYSDGTSQDITQSVTWTASDTTIATVDAAGKTTSVKAGGPVTITAASGSISGAASLTVTAATLQSIVVTPGIATIPIGLTQQFTATGVYSDGTSQDITTSVAWTTDNTGVATINAFGVATAIAGGNTVTITAALGNVSATASLTVSPVELQSISVTPASASIAVGLTQQFKAMGTYSDGSSQDITTSVTWASANTGLATVSPMGLATAVAVGGPVTITASVGNFSGTASLTITNASLQSIAVTPPTAMIAVGGTQKFTATGTYSDGSTPDMTGQVIWASDNTAIATVTTGTAYGNSAGTAHITASSGNVSGSATLTVTAATLQSISISPASGSIAAGQTLQFTATGTYSDGSTPVITNQVTWKSDNTAAATVSGGVATGIAAGTANITASLGNITSASAALTVTPAVIKSIAVGPSGNPSIAAGRTQQFTATATYTNGTTTNLASAFIWSTGSTTIAAVSANGLATGVGPGQTQIFASAEVISGSAWITVTPAYLVSIAVQPSNPSITAGGAQQFFAEGIYTDGTTTDLSSQVTWKSSNTPVATVDAAGLATGKGAGTAYISATWNLDASYWNEASLTVTSAAPGITWTLRSSLTTTDLKAVAWSGTTYVAVGNDSTILTSTDGKTWSSQASNDLLLSNLNDVVWTGTQFVAAGDHDTFLSSPDGITWTLQGQDGMLTGNPGAFTGLAMYPNKPYVIRLRKSLTGGSVSFSTDNGTTWSLQSGTTAGYMLAAVAPLGASTIAVGAGGGIYTGLISDVGETLITQNSTTTQTLYSVAAGLTPLGAFYVVVGDNGAALWSTDEVTWGAVHNSGLPYVSLRRVIWDGNQFVAVSTSGGIFTDNPLSGGSWTAQTSGTTQNLYGITWSGSQYVAVGASGTIVTSP